MPFPQTALSLNQNLYSTANWTVITRQESITGYISVLENADMQLRVLRCDHSLLGGEWLPPSGRKHKSKVREPIYAVFAMLEAVRLVEISGPEHAEEASAKSKAAQNALMIGLGVGTSAAALIEHGVNTTIVEIDPIVHKYATEYFGLPLKHNAAIEDAVNFVQRAERQHSRYDFIIHDVFTGGAEPVSLFTVEFISTLHRLLKPDGVIAINYAGDLLLPPARLIIRTILSVFSSCRIFREEEAPTNTELEHDFTNLVIFCINSASQFSFRRPTQADLLGSRFREMYLYPRHEVDSSLFKRRVGDEEVLSVANTETLEKWRRKGAISHWRIMRTVLPDVVWESW
ncbi:MAG: hypothetical protein M1816_001430 [Peltula sp. TS41687]|nr:MAG: hypothetical protein M1816_001430 [Peltula sp. TS41687]